MLGQTMRSLVLATCITVILWQPSAEAGQTMKPYKADDAYYGITDNVPTPHIPWSKPYAKGDTKALIIAPAFTQRETVELAQRMSLDYTTVVAYRSQDLEPIRITRHSER